MSPTPAYSFRSLISPFLPSLVNYAWLVKTVFEAKGDELERLAEVLDFGFVLIQIDAVASYPFFKKRALHLLQI